MKHLILFLIMAGMVACASHRANTSFRFANNMAMQGVWEEAVYRWKLSLETEGESAAVHNNLAVAYERQGNGTEAEKEYKKALAIDPENVQIKSNYDQFQKKWKGK